MSDGASQDRQNHLPADRDAPGVTSARRRFNVDWGALTHRGRVRENNEDCFFLGVFDRMLQPVLTNLLQTVAPCWHYESGYVVVVADGMGGEVGGEVASHTAVSTLLDLAVDTPDWIMRYDEASFVDEVTRRIEERMRQVDEVLQEIGRSDPKLAGLGTTITALALLPPYAVLAHVGDSRAYLLRNGQLRQLTRDHTMAQHMVDAGLIDPADVASHPARSVLTRAAGHGGGLLTVDVHRLHLAHGDQVLLCSDGLTAMLGDDDIARVLADAPASATACKTLVSMALDRGGHDNVTVVLGHVVELPLR